MDAPDPSARAVGQADLGIFHLSRSSLPPQLPDDFGDLGDTCSSQRMAFGKQAAAGIHRELAADPGFFLIDQPRPFPRLAEPRFS